MNRTLLGVLVVSLAGCAPTPKPLPQRPSPTFALTVCLASDDGQPMAGTVSYDGAQPREATKIEGCTPFFGLEKADFTGLTLTASADGYTSASARVTEARDQALTIRLAKIVTTAGESGPLHIEGTTFRRQDGSIFQWVGASDFALFARYARGEDITPILDERIDIGFNVLRVFGMFDAYGIGGPQASGLGAFTPATTVDYYTKLRAFVELCESRGMRVEIVALADADERRDRDGNVAPDGNLMPDLADQQAHVQRVFDALAGTWGATVEYANEAFKNAARVEEIRVDRHGILSAYGTVMPGGDIPSVWPHLDYITAHDHERKDEWPRTSRGYGEIVDVLKVPVVADEPIGFAEVADPGRRAGRVIDREHQERDESTKPIAELRAIDDAADFAATMAMFASGATFHGNDGVASQLFGPVQLAAAKAWTWAARWVPPEAQLAAYQRGGECGTGGIGNMPIQHCDLETGAPSRALRSFCKYAFGAEWCVRIRAVGPTEPRDGWQITEEPRPGFAKLTR